MVHVKKCLARDASLIPIAATDCPSLRLLNDGAHVVLQVIAVKQGSNLVVRNVARAAR